EPLAKPHPLTPSPRVDCEASPWERGSNGRKPRGGEVKSPYQLPKHRRDALPRLPIGTADFMLAQARATFRVQRRVVEIVVNHPQAVLRLVGYAEAAHIHDRPHVVALVKALDLQP